MIYLDPNPSVDHILTLGRLARGAVQCANTSRSGPSGKGVNVANPRLSVRADVAPYCLKDGFWISRDTPMSAEVRRWRSELA